MPSMRRGGLWPSFEFSIETPLLQLPVYCPVVFHNVAVILRADAPSVIFDLSPVFNADVHR